MLGLIPFDFQQYSTVADRYAYLALLGPALAGAWWIHGHASRRNLTIATLPLLLLAVATYRQTGYWRDSESLFLRTIQINPGSHLAHNNLALQYLKAGEPRLAAHHAELALELKPDSLDARFVRALAQSSLGHIEEAIHEYERILNARPDYTEAQLNRAVLEYRLGRVESAIEQYRQLLERSPDNALAHRKLGGVLASEGHLNEAISHLSRAVAIAPQDALAHAELARALAINEQPRQAISHYRASLTLRSPEWPLVANRLAHLLATHPDPTVRNGQDALRLAQAACEQSDYAAPELLQTLAAAHAELGRFDDAVTVATQAAAKAREQGKRALADELELNLASYLDAKPWRAHPHQRPATEADARPQPPAVD